MFYGRTSQYIWTDEDGNTHDISQGEGGEQGDPLMPYLYALGQHDALAQAAQQLQEGEHLFAFLDDFYLITASTRTAEAFQLVTREVQERAGIQTNLGKTQIWNQAGGAAPPGLTELGLRDAWKGTGPAAQQGLVILGTPLGTPEFIEAKTRERLDLEAELLALLPGFDDLQAAWLILYFCANPRATHWLRILPPSLSEEYAATHDEFMWGTLKVLVSLPEGPRGHQARQWVTLPHRMGGLGLQSASRTAPAAYWASLADAMPIIQAKAPTIAAAILEDLDGEANPTSHSMQEARDARVLLESEQGTSLPAWATLAAGVRPPQNIDADPGEWRRGWQTSVSDVRN
jgi:hypothetical protein